MPELEISQTIKIIIGIAVIIVVVGGIYLFFKESVLAFFKNLFSAGGANFVLALLK
jgi:hypothetical protein